MKINIDLFDGAGSAVSALVHGETERLGAFVSEHTPSVSELELSPRAKNVLRFNGVSSLEQLLLTASGALRSMQLMDEKTEREITLALSAWVEQHAEEIRSFAPTKQEEPAPPAVSPVSGSAEALLADADGRARVIEALRAMDKIVPVESLGLSVRAYHCLKRTQQNTVAELIALYPDGYLELKSAGQKTVEELRRAAEHYVRQYLPQLGSAGEAASPAGSDSTALQTALESLSIRALLTRSDTRAQLDARAAAKDEAIDDSAFSVRARGALANAGVHTMRALLRYYPDGYASMKNAGGKTVAELRAAAETYAERLRQELLLFGTEDDMEPRSYPESVLRAMVLQCFRGLGFQGLHYADVRAQCPENVIDAELKRVIAALLREGALEYVDFRLYKCYPSILQRIREMDRLSEREREVLLRRIDGEKLDAIGQSLTVTRERVRQIESRALQKLRGVLDGDDDAAQFDEAYYLYFYTTYDVPRPFWTDDSGAADHIRAVLDLLCQPGTRPLERALEDDRLDVALRIRVLNYLNRGKIYLDGQMVTRSRAEVEDYIIRVCCRESTPFDVFVERYNSRLQANRVPLDSELYITDAVRRTRENAVAESRFGLWKQGRLIRYYDIDGGDYAELYETLALEDYENTEVSTLKFMEEYPELMRKYDIRDEYELHNLLRKTADVSRFRGLDVQRQPILRFGTFDRDEAILRALAVLSPIPEEEFVQYLHDEFGYAIPTIRGMHLRASAYLRDGVYDIGAPRMPAERRERFARALQEDLYPIRRLVALYRSMFPDAQEGEVNAGDLREMGFRVYTEFALRNYSSLDAYFTELLTEKGTATIRDKLRRYSGTSAFYSVYKRLKRRYDILLCEPDLVVSLDRLGRAGVTREEIRAFADAALQLVEDGEYFTVPLLRRRGLSTSLDRLGFEDFFLTEILAEDPRCASQHVFGATVLCKTSRKKEFTVREFLFALLSEHTSVDLDDFMAALSADYGLPHPNAYKIIELVRDSSESYYYDDIMRTIYRDKSVYLSELDD